MTRKEARETEAMLSRLQSLGISRADAESLRRISMTLHRWHELECGDSDEHGSWTVTRGRSEMRYGQHADGHGPHRVFLYDDNGKPFIEHHVHMWRRDPATGKQVCRTATLYTPTPDREAGARKRLAEIMARYPTLTAYVQGDPRGAALYILRPGDVPAGEDVGAYYNRGIAVHK